MYDLISREQRCHVEDLTLADVAAFLEGAEEVAGLIVDSADADGTALWSCWRTPTSACAHSGCACFRGAR